MWSRKTEQNSPWRWEDRQSHQCICKKDRRNLSAEDEERTGAGSEKYPWSRGTDPTMHSSGGSLDEVNPKVAKCYRTTEITGKNDTWHGCWGRSKRGRADKVLFGVDWSNANPTVNSRYPPKRALIFGAYEKTMYFGSSSNKEETPGRQGWLYLRAATKCPYDHHELLSVWYGTCLKGGLRWRYPP